MKSLRLLRWSGTVLSPRRRPPPCLRCQRPPPACLLSTSPPRRQAASALFTDDYDSPDDPPDDDAAPDAPAARRDDYAHLPSPPPATAPSSARLHALHARLALPPRFPVQTLARCLIDPTADAHPAFNNAALARLGHDLLGHHAAERLLCRHPRLPLRVLFAAVAAYAGPGAAAALVREWGVESAAWPGGEVDPGLLQYLPVVPGRADVDGSGVYVQDRRRAEQGRRPWTRGASTVTALTTQDSYLGEPRARRAEGSDGGRGLHHPGAAPAPTDPGATHEMACLGFVRALLGGVYLHGGRAAARAFFDAHVASRRLDAGALFDFQQPTRDLARLCAREGFAAPVARLLAETGRLSRAPVFVVGVFSADQKLGEGQGASKNEARVRAAVSALKSWYLYSPLEPRVPSDVEGAPGAEWKPVLIDGGEVIV